jgi:hypothetical protein
MPKPTLLVAGKLAGAAGRAAPEAVPIAYIVRWFRRRMPEFGGRPPARLADRVLVVRSETGSGKSTVLPAALLRLVRSEATAPGVRLRRAGVTCTQPRVLTAQTLARDMAADDENYPDLQLGVTVGFQTGPMDFRPPRGLVYATVGSLLAQLRAGGGDDGAVMARHRFIVVDEAHERALDLDALLLRLKGFLARNLGDPRLPFVVLASATLPVEKYARYFALPPANVVEVTGRAYPIAPRWPPRGTRNYPAEAAAVAVEIHEANPEDPPERADILIFVPGARETAFVVDALEEANWAYRAPGSRRPPFLVLVLNREVVLEHGRDFALLKAPPAALRVPVARGGGAPPAFVRPSRPIAVSTGVAETGLTIETLKYVVEPGWNRAALSFFPGAFRGVATVPAPRSRVRQRRGRAGRKFPGEFYPLYTRDAFDALPEEQAPDVVAAGVAPIFLDVVVATADAAARAAARAAGRPASTCPPPGAPGALFRLADVDMLDAPPTDALAAALDLALSAGLLRDDPPAGGQRLTPLGAAAARFTFLGMPAAAALAAGFLWRVAIEDLALLVVLFPERLVALSPRPPPGADASALAAAARSRALRAGLPEFLRGGAHAAAPADGTAVGGGGAAASAPPGAEALEPLRARLLLADDFLEALLAFEGFARAAETAGADLPALLDWCEAHGVDFAGATALAAAREQALTEFLTAGFNPHWGRQWRLAAAPAAAFLDTAVRLKHCLAAALGHFSLDLDLRARAYRVRSTRDEVALPPGASAADLGAADAAALGALSLAAGLGPFDAADVFAGARPRRLVTSSVAVLPSPPRPGQAFPPALYDLVPGLVSVLDGYVPPDPLLRAPRLFVPQHRTAPPPADTEWPPAPPRGPGSSSPSSSSSSSPSPWPQPEPSSAGTGTAPAAAPAATTAESPSPYDAARAYARACAADPAAARERAPFAVLPPALRRALYGPYARHLPGGAPSAAPGAAKDAPAEPLTRPAT